jgi:hypothetical protein
MATVDHGLRTPPPLEAQLDVLASDVGGPGVAGMPADGARQEPILDPMARREARAESRRSWPLMLALAWWPVWWALGISQLVFILAAIPLAWLLTRRGRLVYPPGFLLWGLFLVLVLVSGLALNAEAVGAAPPSGAGRFFAYGLRLANYGAITVVLLYIINASERELPRRSLINWFGVLGTSAVALGLLSLAFPDLQWTSPVARILPDFLTDAGVNRLAQVQGVLGDPTPRPAAPYAYTNAWGNSTALLLIWMVVAYGIIGSSRRRLYLALILLAAVPPVVYSLNRAMWMGLALAAVVVVARLAMRGRLVPVASLAVVTAVLALAVALSPLGGLVEQRLQAGHSNEIRQSLASAAVDIAKQSPIVGFGSTRDTIGSEASIAVGPTQECPRCGGRVIGSTGQFTLLLVAQGFLGLFLYVSFLVVTLWRFRSDHSPLGIAAWVVILLELFFGFFYTALTMPLAITFCSIGLLCRNAQVRSEAGRGP